jgi:hypothetical protein
MVPATLNTPTIVSIDAATGMGIPWLCASGTKWVHITPLVDAPHTANMPASSQNGPVLAASHRTCRVRRAAGAVGGLAADWAAP